MIAGDNIEAMSEGIDAIEVETSGFNIPSEIKVVFPEVPDIQIIHDIPMLIKVKSVDLKDIEILGAENIPSEIKLVSELPDYLELKVDTKEIKELKLSHEGIPSKIFLEVPDNFPSKIELDVSKIPDKIQVEGIPSTIELTGAPSQIQLVLPEKPEIELVYKGSPIDVKINLDVNRLTGDNDGAQCVAIVPCPNK